MTKDEPKRGRSRSPVNVGNKRPYQHDSRDAKPIEPPSKRQRVSDDRDDSAHDSKGSNITTNRQVQ